MFLIRKPQVRKPQVGVTLIELMIVVTIVSILAAVGYPSYIQYTVKANRSAAQSYLLSVANKQEQYMLDARQYFSTSTTTGCTNVIAANSVGVALPPEVTKHYDIDICANSAATPPTYQITANPKPAQTSNDSKCGSVTLDQAGTKGRTGTGTVADCW